MRFVASTRNIDSGVESGLSFEIAYAVAKHADTSAIDEEAIREQLAWFAHHLPIPSRFNRSRSKGYYRRKTKGICWFKSAASECLARMHILRQIVEAHGYHTVMLREDRIGYVVYQDEFQVVAEPFHETPTRP